MKKLLLTIIVALLLVSCGKSEKEKTTNQSESKMSDVAVKKATGPLVKMQYKFSKGDKFTYKLTTITNNKEVISADTLINSSITQTASYIIDFTVKNIDEYKIAELEARVKSIIAETDFNGQKLKYDSKFIYSTREKAQFVDYEAVKKVPFRISINEIGQVVKVDKIDKIMKNILSMQNVPDTLSAATKEKMRNNIANGTLMPLTQQIFKVVSEDEVGVDSTWQMKYSTPLAVYNIENTAVFKITDIDFSEDTTASISSNLIINVSGDDVVNEQGVQYTFVKPNLEATGSLKYSIARGLVLQSESNTKLEMSMTMEGRDNNNMPIRSNKKDYSNNTNIVELL